MGILYIWVTTFTFLGHMTSSVTWLIDPPSYWCPIVTEPLSLTVYEIFASKYIWVTILTFLGHVTSSVTWPFDFPGAISYRCSIVTESPSPTIFETMGIFYIWVTTLTFLGQVTSSVTWPIDPPYFISYWCPIVTEPLSLTVFEIFDPQYPCAHTHTHTHKHRNTPQVILYSVPCNVLHWTDNNISVIFFIVAIIMDVLYRPTHPHTGTRDIVCGTTLKSVNFSSSSNPSWIPPSKTGYQASFGRSNTNDVDGIQSQETNSHAELCVLDFVFVDFLSYCLAVFLSPSCSQLKNV